MQFGIMGSKSKILLKIRPTFYRHCIALFWNSVTILPVVWLNLGILIFFSTLKINLVLPFSLKIPVKFCPVYYMVTVNFCKMESCSVYW